MTTIAWILLTLMGLPIVRLLLLFLFAKTIDEGQIFPSLAFSVAALTALAIYLLITVK